MWCAGFGLVRFGLVWFDSPADKSAGTVVAFTPLAALGGRLRVFAPPHDAAIGRALVAACLGSYCVMVADIARAVEEI